LASDPVQLWLDGKEVKLEEPLSLQKGPHPIRLELAKDSGNELAMTFIWKKPGDEKWEVVPATAFGKIPVRVSGR
jgi:hypothetical protein